MELSIKTNFPSVQRQLDSLRADVAGRAVASALNKVTAQGKTQMQREIGKAYNLSASRIRETLRVSNASFRQGQFEMKATLESKTKRGRSLNLVNFVERTVTIAAARSRTKAGEGGRYKLRNGATVSKVFQLRFKIKRGGKAFVIKGAFLGNGGRTVFIRQGANRLPIKALQTIDVSQMFNAKRINSTVVQLMQGKFPGVFENEARFYTDRFNRSKGGA